MHARTALAAVAVAGGALLAGALPGHAASFSCSNASTPTEHAICTNPQLSSLDDQTSGMYYTIVGSGGPPGTVSQVKNAQSAFLRQRDSCGANFNCLVSAYTTQMMYLKQVKEQLGL